MSRIKLESIIGGAEYSFWIKCLMFSDEYLVFVSRYGIDLEGMIRMSYNE